ETYSSEKVALAPGDALMLYTDGISESQDCGSNQYGEERLMKLLATADSLPASQLIKRCLEDVKGFRNGNAQSDDMTMLVVRRRK
ncbi:MAG: serine/threonine-protein phosphatase, partial [Ignavibacteria bacterium]